MCTADTGAQFSDTLFLSLPGMTAKMAAPKKCNFLLARIADIMLYIRGLGRRRLGIASSANHSLGSVSCTNDTRGTEEEDKTEEAEAERAPRYDVSFLGPCTNYVRSEGRGGCPFISEGNRMNLEIFANISSGRSRGRSGRRRATGGARRYGAVVTGSKFIFPRFARAPRLPRFAT